ncbi:hemoglobin subunit epsilon-like [Ptychodera flava]|uniref:hemoglobin subunit epsilon-like n=1 Tax=Ptychodera flava TaxID=63121 RepID=UPI003969E06B
MGCSDSTHAVSQRNSNANAPIPKMSKAVEFTPMEVSILRGTWPVMASDMTTNGGKIFLRIFSVAPAVKDLFPFRYVPDSMLSQTESFKMHGRRFMQSVGAVIENLDNLDGDISVLLYNLGVRHCDFDGVSQDYFNLYTDCMIYTWDITMDGDKFTPEVRETWRKLFDFIIGRVKEGFASGKKAAEDKAG